MKVLGKDVETHPEVPAPLPFRKFMVYIISQALVRFFREGIAEATGGLATSDIS